MKVALVHDYIKEYGGAEKVLEALHEVFPDAPVYTTVYCPEFLGPHRERFADWKIKTSWLQHIPFKHKLISPFRLLAPLVFKQFNFSGYDVVIVSATGAYSPNGIRTKASTSSARNSSSLSERSESKGKGPIHVCYCHTPPRYLYGYPTARDWKSNKFSLVIGTIANHPLRIIDVNSNQNVEHFIANSEEVKARVEKFYRKEATVIYPPVGIMRVEGRGDRREKSEELKSMTLNPKPYYLAGSRLARAKHIDLIVKTAKKYKLTLKVFGKGFAGYEEDLKSLALNEENIDFLGEVTEKEKFDLMANAKAYLFASEYEDFGIAPVEAMGMGTPVIAYRSGGVKETVIDGKTGVFFDDLTIESLKSAIDRLEKEKIDPKDCITEAERFGKEKFKTKMQEFIKNLQK